MRVSKLGVFGCDEEVTVQCEFKTTSNGDAVNSADEWLRDLGERTAHTGGVHTAVSPCTAEVASSVAQFLEVKSSTEGGVGACEDEDVHIVVGIGLLHELWKKLQNLAAQGVTGCRAIESNGGDAVAHLVENHVGHGSTVGERGRSQRSQCAKLEP